MDEVIYLEPDDDLVSIRDRLEWAESKRVLIVLPKGSQCLASPISMKLLRRHARALSKEVALVTSDAETRRLAQAEGLAAFRRMPRRWWRLGRGIRRGRERDERLRRPRGFRSLGEIGQDLASRWAQLAAFLLLLVLLGSLVATMVMVVPVARITLRPQLIPVVVQVPLVARVDQAEIDVEAGLIPARAVEETLEGSGQIPTSARHDAPDLPARGEVVFINQAGEEVEVPQGTVVRTSTGTAVRFSTVQTVTVPPPVGGKAQVEVEALTPGPMGNVAANLINQVEGSLGLRLSVTNPEPTSGGSMKQVGFVTYADKERLRESVLQKLEQEGLHRLQAGLASDEFLFPSSLEVTVLDEVYDPSLVEVEAEVLRVTLRGRVRGLAISEQAANQVALGALEQRAREYGRLLPQGLEFERDELAMVHEDGESVSFIVTARGMAVPELDLAWVRESIAGMPIGDARDWLGARLPLAEPPQISVRPNWFGRIPWLTYRVHLFVQVGGG